MGWPWTYFEWGPIWLPGIYDEPFNPIWLRFLAFVVVMMWLRHFSEANIRYFYSKKRLDGKVAIVTGSENGVGKETVKGLVQRGCRVIMASDDLKEACEAKDEIVKATQCNTDSIIIRKMDPSSFKSIREFANDIIAQEDRLDILIHSAEHGNMVFPKTSQDGIELSMAVNYFGIFLLTNLLIDLFKKTPNSRIIVLTCKLYHFIPFYTTDLNPNWSLPVYMYCKSKAANVMFAIECARRFKEAGMNVTINSGHPGIVINAGFWKHATFPFSYILDLAKRHMKDPYQGSQMPLFLAISDDLDKTSGLYFKDMRPDNIRKSLLDETSAKILWEETIKIVGLTEKDPKI